MPPNSATKNLTAKPWGYHCGATNSATKMLTLMPWGYHCHATKLGHEEANRKNAGTPVQCHQTRPRRCWTAKPWEYHCGATKLGHKEVDCKTVGIPLRCHQTWPRRRYLQKRGDTTAVSTPPALSPHGRTKSWLDEALLGHPCYEAEMSLALPGVLSSEPADGASKPAHGPGGHLARFV